MIKMTYFLRLALVGLALLGLIGCTFIVMGENTTKYYGIDQQRGSEYLNQILKRQQEVYQAKKISVDSKKP